MYSYASFGAQRVPGNRVSNRHLNHEAHLRTHHPLRSKRYLRAPEGRVPVANSKRYSAHPHRLGRDLSGFRLAGPDGGKARDRRRPGPGSLAAVGGRCLLHDERAFLSLETASLPPRLLAQLRPGRQRVPLCIRAFVTRSGRVLAQARVAPAASSAAIKRPNLVVRSALAGAGAVAGRNTSPWREAVFSLSNSTEQ